MKGRQIFQILHGFCYWDATATVKSLERAATMYAPSIRFEEAPSYVREGWAFDDTKEGDERFIQPVAPEGWGYDLEKGVFYPLEGTEVPDPETFVENSEVEEVENVVSESEDN